MNMTLNSFGSGGTTFQAVVLPSKPFFGKADVATVTACSLLDMRAAVILKRLNMTCTPGALKKSGHIF